MLSSLAEREEESEFAEEDIGTKWMDGSGNWTGVVNDRPREDPPFTHFDEETGGEGGKR